MQVLVALRPGGMISHHLHGKHFGAIHDHLLSGLFHVSQLDFLLPALRSYSFYPHSIQSILKCTAVRSWHSSLQWPPISFRIQVKRPHKGLVGSPQAVTAPTPRPCLSPLFPVLSLWPPCLLQILCIFLSQGTYSLCLEYASPEIHSVFLPFKTAPEHHMTRRFFPTTWHKTAHYWFFLCPVFHFLFILKTLYRFGISLLSLKTQTPWGRECVWSLLSTEHVFHSKCSRNIEWINFTDRELRK